MSNANFELATRKKFRFTTARNQVLTVEDLWDLNLRGQNGLDGIAKSLNRKLKEADEESFVETKTTANKELEEKLEIVKHVIAHKLDLEESRKKASEKKAKREKIMQILEKKQESDLEAKSTEELQKMLEEL